MRLLYFLPIGTGGLFRYAIEQIRALHDAGCSLQIACTPEFVPMAPRGCDVMPILSCLSSRALNQRLPRAASFIEVTLRNHRALARTIVETGANRVLFSAFSEYLAPVWAGPLERLVRRGVIFSATLHDPLRTFQVGPAAWHAWSVRRAAGILREGFVHGAPSTAVRATYPGVRLSEVPHGPYPLPPPSETRETLRRRLDIPGDALLLLAYGYIRDDKNLDLNVRALAALPDAYLIVAGAEQSGRNKSLDDYRSLAAELGVSARCRFLSGSVSEPDTAALFAASDLVLLTYAGSFVSASGVLAQAAQMRRPCLASGGDGPLRRDVASHSLGLTAAADDVDAIVDGIRRWRDHPSTPLYEDYLQTHSWARNAAIVIARMS